MSTQEPTSESVHRPVLLAEVIAGLAPHEGSVLVDGTAGAGGHTAPLARLVGGSGLVIALDRDQDMLAFAVENTRGLPVELIHASYDELGDVLERLGRGPVDGILLDLGLSSDQLGWSHRGFSFSADGPLDMRYDTSEGETAADLVNSLPEGELANIIYQFGEERHSRRVARRIVEERRRAPIQTTNQLAEILRRCIPRRRGQIDPATRTFQALRIAVNHELDRLETTLGRLPDWLAPGGRAAIISFHSLEDRPVKWAFRTNPAWQVLTKKPVTASAEELELNPRARSAKLRVAERCSRASGTSTQPTLTPSPSQSLKPKGQRRPR